MASIPTLRLNDGNEIPVIGYGLGSINMAQRAQHDDVVQRVVAAVQAGYYHLDGAEVYGNEAALGEAIKKCGVAREKLFVTAKLLNAPGQDVQASLDASLEKLGLSYVDLYLIHLPFLAPDALPATWAQMEQAKAAGKARSIGVSNFLQPHLESVLKTATTIPAVNQIEYHPYLQHGGLVDFCRAQDIAVAAYSTLAPITKARPGPVDDVYAALAAKHGVTEAEIALKWALDQGIVTITTSSKRERLQGYLASFAKFKLSPEEIRQISEAGAKKHYRDLYNDYFSPDDRS